MNVFTMVTIVVVVSVIAGAITKIVQAKHEDKSKTQNNSLVDSLQNEVNNLKERVKTLEALVTDHSYRVKSEIDKL